MFSRKIISVLFVILVLLPSTAFGQENVEEVEHLTIPITLVPVASESSFQTTSEPVTGYLDFWSDVNGDQVIAHWRVTLTTPGAYITSVNLSVLWSQGGVDSSDSFVYSTYGTPTYVANDAENIYFASGKHTAIIGGSVMTTKGTAYTVSPGTITFYTE